jgi:arylsulfatase A-like enzyme
MPFPRVKGNVYEFANHLPLAAMWPNGIAKPGRTVDDMVSFIDFAPTFVELAGLSWAQTAMAEPAGHSLTDIFRSEKSGVIDPARDFVLVGKERTDVGRPNDAGYPTRGIIKGGWMYLQNYETSRWPAGNPETGYLDCDGGATKTFILNAHRANPKDAFWAYCFGMRPSEELYDTNKDPDCLKNLALGPSPSQQSLLREQLLAELRRQDDPRMGEHGDVFDRYEYAEKPLVGFYERFMRGEKIRTGWVNDSDYEKEPLPLQKP